MSPSRRTAALAGALYFVTHVTSVAAVALYGPMRSDPGWVLGDASATPVVLGAMLDVMLALAVVGTAVALYPLVRRVSARGALGYVALRTLEACGIVLGAVAVLALVAVRGLGLEPAVLAGVGGALVAVYTKAFFIGPSLVVVVHSLLLAVVLYRHRSVPRWIPVLSFVGAPLVLVSNLLVQAGVYGYDSPWAPLSALPLFAWEISLALRLILRGLDVPAQVVDPLTRGAAPAVPHPAAVPA
ncbi:DUF4386 domain-containing protein [Actinotalea sp. M2MS4P-6]|uniref:DUF4386 domain-containing protein n=1 Tax=Actinotalea sp. M2MS4P-6 TaxID=2983762 RepID=UPI0021E4D2D2|nr:DUF4386 domain-containing protein [Actinotalea sp. M2MS4P-6]MCV2394268.1 DUF4386 domain-containing protein [Actinotalea sp. M2MS4P-6]